MIDRVVLEVSRILGCRRLSLEELANLYHCLQSNRKLNCYLYRHPINGSVKRRTRVKEVARELKNYFALVLGGRGYNGQFVDSLLDTLLLPFKEHHVTRLWPLFALVKADASWIHTILLSQIGARLVRGATVMQLSWSNFPKQLIRESLGRRLMNPTDLVAFVDGLLTTRSDVPLSTLLLWADRYPIQESVRSRLYDRIVGEGAYAYTEIYRWGSKSFGDCSILYRGVAMNGREFSSIILPSYCRDVSDDAKQIDKALVEYDLRWGKLAGMANDCTPLPTCLIGLAIGYLRGANAPL